MDQTHNTPGAARSVRMMHTALIMGVLLAGVAFAFQVSARQYPPEGGKTLGMVLPTLGIGLLLVSVSVLRPRVRERSSQQSSDGYWAAVETRRAAIILWAVAEGAAFISLVGYFLSGALAGIAVAVLALAVLILYRPSRLERS